MTAPTGLSIRDLHTDLRGPFTCDLAVGSCTVLTGPSGIGKSLLLRMIADLDPNEGTVSLNGLDRDAMDAPRWRSLVTYVAAEAGWWAETVFQHMKDLVAARALITELGLDIKMIDEPIARLSTGERQRMALIRAVVGKPRFLLLDEPTSALDDATKRLVEAVLLRLKQSGLGLLVVSHDHEQAERMADRHFVMSRSGLREVGP